jgi:hypothetical protein
LQGNSDILTTAFDIDWAVEKYDLSFVATNYFVAKATMWSAFWFWLDLIRDYYIIFGF